MVFLSFAWFRRKARRKRKLNSEGRRRLLLVLKFVGGFVG